MALLTTSFLPATIHGVFKTWAQSEKWCDVFFYITSGLSTLELHVTVMKDKNKNNKYYYKYFKMFFSPEMQMWQIQITTNYFLKLLWAFVI